MLKDLPEDIEHGARTKRQTARAADDNDAERKGRILSAKDIEESVHASEKPVEQAEINASIDSMRPQHTVLEQAEFDSLVHRLTRAYNVTQLSGYLGAGLEELAEGEREREDKSERIAIVSAWQVGKTPLTKRLPTKRTKGGKQKRTSKADTASQILRLVWNVVVHSEEQAIGEMEMKLQPWQIACLFDLTLKQEPLYRKLFASNFLLRASEIRPHRPDSVVRITARRQDAEEITRLLQLGLLNFQGLTFKASNFETLLDRPGWPSSLNQLFSDEDIRMVSDRSAAIIMREPNGDLSIYSQRYGERHTARRLLLSLLHLPSDETFSTFLPLHSKLDEGKHTPADLFTMLPVSDNGLHHRLRRMEWCRLVAPMGSPEPSTKEPQTSLEPTDQKDQMVGSRDLLAAARMSGVINNSDKHLEQPSTMRFDPMVTQEEGYYWKRPEGGALSWRARTGRMVYNVPESGVGRIWKQDTPDFVPGVDPTSHLQTLIPSAPGMEILFSYFHRYKPKTGPEARASKPKLTAHFAPFSADYKDTSESLTTFPRVSISFHIISDPKLAFDSINASPNDHHITALCPDKAVDLQFTRRTGISSGQEALKDPEIAAFAQRLQESASASGVLHAGPSITLKMPHALFGGDSRKRQGKPSKHTNVLYLFERFEKREMLDLLPEKTAIVRLGLRNPRAAELLRTLLWFRLRRYEIDAGEFGGRRVEYELVDGRPVDTLESEGIENAEKQYERVLRLSKAAYALADLVTMASRGELPRLPNRLISNHMVGPTRLPRAEEEEEDPS